MNDPEVGEIMHKNIVLNHQPDSSVFLVLSRVYFLINSYVGRGWSSKGRHVRKCGGRCGKVYWGAREGEGRCGERCGVMLESVWGGCGEMWGKLREDVGRGEGECGGCGKCVGVWG